MKTAHESIGERLREEICPRCARLTRTQGCSLGDRCECPINVHMERVVDLVSLVHSARIDAYVDQLRLRVCANCNGQDAGGHCALRDASDCALDAYFPLVVDLIERELACAGSGNKSAFV